MAAVQAPVKSHNDILRAIHGQNVHIPPMIDLFPRDWPHKLHPDYESVKQEVNEWLKRVVPSKKYAAKMIDADMTYLACMFLSKGSRSMSLAYAKWVHWAFQWDDIMDNSEMVFDMETARRYRDQAIGFCKQSLVPEVFGPTQPTDWPVIDQFDEVGSMFRAELAQDHRQVMLRETINYIIWCEREQANRHDELMLSVEEYEKYRFFTGAVMPFLVGAPAAGGCNHVQADDLDVFWELWSQCNWAVVFVNDLLSLKKEVIAGHAETLVPIMATSECANHSIPEAIEKTVEKIREAIRIFEREERQILDRLAKENASEKKIADYQKVIDLAKTYAVGNASWHYHTPRYLTAEDTKVYGGAVDYTLDCWV